MDEDELAEREKLLFDDPNDRPRTGSTVIRLRSDRLALETFAPLFVNLLGLIRADATKLCQQESGLLLDNVDAAIAEQVAAALREQGEDCFIVSAADIVMLPRPQPVHGLQFTKAGLALRGATEQLTQVGWEELTVLAVAHVAVEESHLRTTYRNPLMQNVGMGAAFGGLAGAAIGAALNPNSSQKVVKSSATRQFLDLGGLNGPLYFRIDARQFDYSILGNQLQQGSTANLLTLTRWLVTYHPKLRTNIDIEHLKQSGTATLTGHSVHGLTQVTQWLLNLEKFGKEPLPPHERHY